MAYRWSGPLMHVAPTVTGDNRRYAGEGMSSRSLPLPLRYSPLGGHIEGAVDIGGITSMDLSSNPIMGSGFFLPSHIEPQVVPAMYKVAAGINAPSVDLEPGSLQAAVTEDDDGQRILDVSKARIMAATIVSKPAFADNRINIISDADSSLPMPMALIASVAERLGWEITEVDDDWAVEQYALVAAAQAVFEADELSVRGGWAGMPIASGNPPWDKSAALRAVEAWAGNDMGKYAQAFLWKDASGDPKLKASYKFPIATVSGGHLVIVPNAVRNAAARVGASDIPDADKKTMQATIHTILMRISGGTTGNDMQGLVAGGGPLAPSKHVFEDPKLTKPTKVTITPDGRVYGHVALWKTCHTGVGNACVLPPHSKMEYAKFHTGNVLTAEGDVVEAGKITLGGGHANTRLGLIPAAEHYDNTCAQVAVVRAGEDSQGIWFAGSLLPGVSDERIAELRRSPLSGDWRLDRTVNNLELIAALAVNSPGFPVFEMDGADQLSLVAAGMVVDMAENETAIDGQDERAAALAAIVVADDVRKQNERARKLAELTGEEK